MMIDLIESVMFAAGLGLLFAAFIAPIAVVVVAIAWVVDRLDRKSG